MADGSEDHEAVQRQLGREPRPFRVAARCPFGLPSVIENERARNMPTSFWVTCPSLVSDISSVESTGGVREAGEAVGTDTAGAINEEHRAPNGTRDAGAAEG